MGEFNVTYDVITPESAEYGDTAENGFVIEDATFSSALDAFAPDWRYCGFPHIEANEWPVSEGIRWFTIHDEMDIETGCENSRSLHIPEHIKGETRLRIARFLGAVKL